MADGIMTAHPPWGMKRAAELRPHDASPRAVKDSKGQGGKGAGPASSAGHPGGQPPRRGGGPNASQDDSHPFAQTISSLQR
eukprot:7556427-Pyramimonas_sp.AAC.1